MRRREREGKAANGLRSKPARGLARDMGGMVVENDLDRGVGGVGGVEQLETLDEFAAAVAFLDQGMDVTGEQIDPAIRVRVRWRFTRDPASRSGWCGKWRAIRAVVPIAWIPGFCRKTMARLPPPPPSWPRLSPLSAWLRSIATCR